MTTKRQLLRNLNWNWAGTFGDVAVSFLLCPFLLTNLGVTHYGAWVMIGALTGYFGLLDLGIRGSVGRFVAFYHARSDARSVNEIVSTAVALLSVAGLASLLAAVVAACWTETLVGGDFQASDFPTLRLALLLAGINLAVQLPLRVADGILWGCQRFDQLNAVRIPSDIARGVLSAAVVYFGGGLIALSTVALLLTVIGGVAKALLAIRTMPSLRLRIGGLQPGRVREVFSFGIWSTVRSLTSMIPARGTPLLVGALLSVSLVAPLSIATRLLASASAILVAASGVITPLATTLHAQSNRSREQNLLLVGGKYSLAAATIFLALFVWLGKPLITLWVGPDMLLAYPMLVVLAAGRWLSMSQVVTRGIITARARHRALAFSSLAQALLSLGLGLVLMQTWGVFGLVAAVAIGDAVCEGLFSWLYGCRLLGVSPWGYAIRLTRSTVAALAFPCGLLAISTWLWPVHGWLELCIHGGSFTVISLACVLLVNQYPLPRSRWQRPAKTGEQIPCVT
jgi:O-antigen/teichoic acid export membrane protein